MNREFEKEMAIMDTILKEFCMNVLQVKQNIKTRNFSPVYIFTGEEIGVMDIFVRQMERMSGKRVARMETFADVFGKVSKNSLLTNSFLYVVRDDDEVLKNEKVWDVLKNAAWRDIVVLLFTSIDKRTKFYKQFENVICVFEPLEEHALIRYIQKEVPLSEKSCRKLIEVCDRSYSRIMLEIEKMKTYKEGMEYENSDIVYDHVFRELLNAGVINCPARDVVFYWCDTVMQRHEDLSFDLLQECFEAGEAVMVMLSVLYNNVKQTFQVQAAKGGEVGKVTGLTGWQIQHVRPFVGNYSGKKLLEAMETIRRMERGIKIGEVEEGMAIPYVLIKMYEK